MSEYMDNQLEYERKVERFIMIVYTLYSAVLIYITSQKNWGIWAFAIYMGGLAVTWSIVLTKSKTFKFRAFVVTSMMQLGLITYSVISKEFFVSLSVMIALICLAGLYEIPNLISICVVSYTFLLIYHMLIQKDILWDDSIDNSLMVLRIMSVYFAAYAIFYLVYNQKEGRKRQMQAIEELKEAERSRDDFLANVSHELRTPINTINGMSEMVLAEENLPFQVRQNVANIQNSGRNLLSVVSDILDFSELQNGNVEIAEESYHISSTIHDIVNMIMARRNEKQLRFVVDCDPQLPSILIGDEQKIRRVIMKLLDNSFKFTNVGCVRLEVSGRREYYGLNLNIKVIDTGIGITQESMEKLFTGFGQVDRRRNRKETGIGLGLAISNAIVEAMGGFITVRSEYGKGSEICFSVPQKIVDDTPIAKVNNADKIHVLGYINTGTAPLVKAKSAIAGNISRTIGKLGIESVICRTLDETKRRMEQNLYTHLFISMEEYNEDVEFFDRVSKEVKVVLVTDPIESQKIKNQNIRKLYKPFYLLPVVMVFNDRTRANASTVLEYEHKRFIAPEAKVLIVDDNIMNIKVAEGMLKPYKIQTECATSGKEALELIRNKSYDFVFMDHMMPEMDGIECYEQIRKIPGRYYQTVPIIALTANAIGGMREVFLEKGFADFVAKPIEVSVLERVLKRNLPSEKIIFSEEGKNEAPVNEATVSVAVVKEDSVTQVSEKENSLKDQKVIGDLDVVAGQTFCGNWEGYLEVLRMQYKDTKTPEKIIEYYENEDWKNYTIYVHGVKSTMKSIGAMPLSEMAKDLEMAGKSQDSTFILAHQDAFMKEYYRVNEMIRSYFEGEKKEENEETNSDLPELEEDKFERFCVEFEEAIYGLDEEKMRGILDELEQYRYCGKELKKVLQTVRKKVDMADYMSALDAMQQSRKKMKQ